MKAIFTGEEEWYHYFHFIPGKIYTINIKIGSNGCYDSIFVLSLLQGWIEIQYLNNWEKYWKLI